MKEVNRMIKQDLLREYSDDEIINLIEENKIEEDLRELLISSINCNRNKLVKYLLELHTDYTYMDRLGYDACLMSISRGNLEALKLLENHGIDMFKIYTIDNKDVTPLSFIRDIDTLKYYETKPQTKDMINNALESIANNTIMFHDIELLKYSVDNYQLNLKNITYKTPDKNYSILEKAEEIFNNMSEALKRKREMTFFADELLYGEENYDRIIKKAYKRLEEFELEVKDIKEYYNYIKNIFEKNLHH